MSILRQISGYSALVVFAAMAVILLVRFPSDALMPQTHLVPYLDREFADFALMLQQEKLGGLYLFTVRFLDSAFLLLFVFWAILSVVKRPGAVIGFAVIGCCVALDLSENQLILARSGLSEFGLLPVEAFVPGVSPVYFVTLAKYAAFLVALLMIGLPWIFEIFEKRDRP